MSNLHLLNSLKIPRYIMGSGNIHSLEKHGFSDVHPRAIGPIQVDELNIVHCQGIYTTHIFHIIY